MIDRRLIFPLVVAIVLKTTQAFTFVKPFKPALHLSSLDSTADLCSLKQHATRPISRNVPPQMVRLQNIKSFDKQQQPLMLRSSSNDENTGDTDESQSSSAKITTDPLIKDVSFLLRRLSWLSWWAQIILTTVAAVTLLFARNVLSRSSAVGGDPVTMPNFVLASTSIALSIGSLFWTWASRRLARRLLKKPTTRIQAANMIRKVISTGVTLNLLGMLFTILGEQQIVGTLAIKVLTTSRSVSFLETSGNLLQPLDILVVQANTNTLFSHFSSLVALLYMTKSVYKLDPPSVENDERRRA